MIIQNTTAILDINLKNKEMGSCKRPDHKKQNCDNLH
ncbi:adenosylmethionine decarboxylase, partial [Francisella tularensis subsp. holarctica]|nr:adenosylmethionine decarboxylase [Francisella tularensis subsp. holarctica]